MKGGEESEERSPVQILCPERPPKTALNKVFVCFLFFFGKESGITVKLGHFLRINESEIFTSFLHLAVGEVKDEAIDGKEGTSNDDLPNPAHFID